MRRTLLSLLAIISLASNPALSNAEELNFENFANEASQDTATGDIAIDETNFPDANFRNWILEQYYGEDGKLTEEEIKYVTYIAVNEKNISTLKGIEFFTSLENLSCENNQLTSIDVSNCTALKYLYCSSTHMTTLDVSKNKALIWLDCHSNQLTSLNVSKNTALRGLQCNLNHINGNAMDNLISSLTYNPFYDSRKCLFQVISPFDDDEGNACSKSQAAVVVAKGWTPQYWDGSSWLEYEGGESSPDAIDITSTNFPDANFRDWLMKQNYGKDGKLTEEEIAGITWIDVSGKGIKSLKGIEYFTALESLWCSSNQLTSLDVSNNTALTLLSCYSNQLTALDVSKNTALTGLSCSSNQLTSLDVSKNTAFTELYCGSNQLTSLDVSKNTELTTLECESNQLTSLDVSKNTALETLWCYTNQLTALDVSNCTALTTLYCHRNQINETAMDDLISSLPYNSSDKKYAFRVISPSLDDEGNVCTKSQVAAAKAKGWTPYFYVGNDWLEYDGEYDPNIIYITTSIFPDYSFRNWILGQDYGKDNKLTWEEIVGIKSIDVSGKNIWSLKGIEYFAALTSLSCHSNHLYSLDVSYCTALTDLDCHSNRLISLDVSNCTALKDLDCHSNRLTTLDVSKNTALTELYCNSNQLTTLDVSMNTALTKLYCHSNQLTALDVSKSTALTELYCYSNQLTALDVSKNTALTELYCYSNQLTDLDVSNNTALTKLSCNSNQLTSLDVSKSTALTELYCHFNQLTALDVSKSTALTELYCYSNQLTALDVSNNTALTTLWCYSNLLTSLDVSKNTALTTLYCYSNQLTALDVSSCTPLTLLSCHRNKIYGNAMDELINSLPYNSSYKRYEFRVISPSYDDERNICTKSQVAAVLAKRWTPYYCNVNNEWLVYMGSDDYQYAQGDVNDDGEVSIGDIVTVTNVMASNETNADVVRRADVNGDGKVGIGDIISITNIMAGE